MQVSRSVEGDVVLPWFIGGAIQRRYIPAAVPVLAAALAVLAHALPVHAAGPLRVEVTPLSPRPRSGAVVRCVSQTCVLQGKGPRAVTGEWAAVAQFGTTGAIRIRARP